MSIGVKDVLEKILLPVSAGWKLDEVDIDEESKRIVVSVKYSDDTVEVGQERFAVYDVRPQRCWRHLDLWEYTTVIKACVLRYRNAAGKVVSAAVPWADAHERLTHLLEKKQ